ncbi:SpoIIE family protein phosphatase [Methylobacterium sp. J-090]|uniref:SpoIIE family protein phosphatase n=1 Tax=Methylobacterium sp. J-090 TaxID=2836666 RepID=UPI001FB8B5E0|nr:SpoIIE family protein phosphatase [Methylobacterium sp. J-090]MCJ2083815.1 SpoIIE family protein phosphatase [Methylobacterium sp. J-090]
MISVVVTEASQVADARRRAVALGQALDFGETASGRLAIVVTELATNLVKYGSPGEILLGTFQDEIGTGVEVIALDKGPGFANLDEALRDGHSTGGSAGTGLGAVRRQSQAFDIAAWPGRGAAIVARLHAEAAAAPVPPSHGAVGVPLRGEEVNGDAHCFLQHGFGWTLLVADGLGHGPQAAQASTEAVRLFRNSPLAAPGEILSTVHAGLRHTRGGAVTVARYEPDRGVVTVAGIGNVAGAVVGGGTIRRTVSLAGTAGHVARRIQEFEYPFLADDLFVLCSDGLVTGWSLDAYPGLVGAHPSLIAGILYRDFARGRDDATVVVARGAAP